MYNVICIASIHCFTKTDRRLRNSLHI
uniref:Uncharacterized protein n=1 Tax=Rhizophora mucronata TaxID=61149 RepID=A0A2P2IWF7_RHIMU